MDEDKVAFLRETLELQGTGECALSMELANKGESGPAKFKVPSTLPIIAAGERLPSGEYRVDIRDGRTPFYVRDPKALVERWNATPEDRRTIPIDFNHDTLFGRWSGGDQKARGRISSYVANDDGSISGSDARWTPVGHDAMENGEFLHTSPVVKFRLETVDGIERRYLDLVESVALTNNPATYTGLASFSRRDGKDEKRVDLDKARIALGLPPTATEAEVYAAMAKGNEALSKLSSNAAPVGAHGGRDAIAEQRAALSRREAEVERQELELEKAKLEERQASLSAQQADLELAKYPHLTPAQKESLRAQAKTRGIEVMLETLAMIPTVDLSKKINGDGEKKSAFSSEDAAVCMLTGVSHEAFTKAGQELFGGDS